MLDFSLGEIGLVAVVALLALGPERLPRVARTTGALVRRARATWHNVRDDIEAELAAGDMTRGVEVVKQIASDLRREIETSSVTLTPSAADSAGSAKPPGGSNISDGNDGTPPTEINIHQTAGWPRE